MLEQAAGVVLWLGFATLFTLWGVAWMLNWHSWADRWADRNRRWFGPLAMWSGSAAYSRFSGVYLVVFGLVLYYGFFRWLQGLGH